LYNAGYPVVSASEWEVYIRPVDELKYQIVMSGLPQAEIRRLIAQIPHPFAKRGK